MLKIGDSYLFNKHEILYIKSENTNPNSYNVLIVYLKNGENICIYNYSLEDIEEM